MNEGSEGKSERMDADQRSSLDGKAKTSNKYKKRVFQFLGDADCGSTPSSLMFSTTFDRSIPAEEREKLE